MSSSSLLSEGDKCPLYPFLLMGISKHWVTFWESFWISMCLEIVMCDTSTLIWDILLANVLVESRRINCPGFSGKISGPLPFAWSILSFFLCYHKLWIGEYLCGNKFLGHYGCLRNLVWRCVTCLEVHYVCVLLESCFNVKVYSCKQRSTLTLIISSLYPPKNNAWDTVIKTCD